MPPHRPAEERFWEKVRKEPDGCWVWAAACFPDGYGLFWYSKTNYCAHRYAYEQAKGPIPAGLVLDHLCRNRACVNPGHLEAVTNQENTQRGLGGRLKTHCKHGHLLAESAYRNPRKPNRRRCRTCHVQTYQRKRPEKKTGYCLHGHLLSPENTYQMQGRPTCKTCRNKRVRANYYRKTGRPIPREYQS